MFKARARARAGRKICSIVRQNVVLFKVLFST